MTGRGDLIWRGLNTFGLDSRHRSVLSFNRSRLAVHLSHWVHSIYHHFGLPSSFPLPTPAKALRCTIGQHRRTIQKDFKLDIHMLIQLFEVLLLGRDLLLQCKQPDRNVPSAPAPAVMMGCRCVLLLLLDEHILIGLLALVEAVTTVLSAKKSKFSVGSSNVPRRRATRARATRIACSHPDGGHGQRSPLRTDGGADGRAGGVHDVAAHHSGRCEVVD